MKKSVKYSANGIVKTQLEPIAGEDIRNYTPDIDKPLSVCHRSTSAVFTFVHMCVAPRQYTSMAPLRFIFSSGDTLHCIKHFFGINQNHTV
jgi:hypothetical protein